MENVDIRTTRALAEAKAGTVICRHRFLEGGTSEGVIPSAIELKRNGGDIVAIAEALESGLSAFALGRAISAGLDLWVFSEALERGLCVDHFWRWVQDIEDIEELNGALECFNEHHEEARQYPSCMERILYRVEQRCLA